MLKVTIDLCEHDGVCSPCMLVTEDNSDTKCPIILPEYMEVDEAKWLTEEIKGKIEEEYTTVEELRKDMYGF